MSCRFVSEHAHTYPVTRLCELVEVPRSSFFGWRSRPLSDHALDDAWFANDIRDIHVASRCTYGSPRIAGQLHNGGRHHGRKRVARIMSECGLVGVDGRKRWRRGKRDTAPAGDLLERDFTAEWSNQRWVADITEFRCRDAWARCSTGYIFGFGVVEYLWMQAGIVMRGTCRFLFVPYACDKVLGTGTDSRSIRQSPYGVWVYAAANVECDSGSHKYRLDVIYKFSPSRTGANAEEFVWTSPWEPIRC